MGDTHVKRSGVFVVSIRGVNQGSCSHLACSRLNDARFSRQGIMQGLLSMKKMEKAVMSV